MFELTQLVDAQVSGDGVEPSREASLVFEFGGLLYQAEEDFLGHIFCKSRLAQLTDREVVDRPVITPHQLSEGLAFSSLITNHEHFVAGLAAHISHLAHPRAISAQGDDFRLRGPAVAGWS